MTARDSSRIVLRFLRAFGPYERGDLAWYSRLTAPILIAKGIAALAPIGNELERTMPMETEMAHGAPEAAVTRRRRG